MKLLSVIDFIDVIDQLLLIAPWLYVLPSQ